MTQDELTEEDYWIKELRNSKRGNNPFSNKDCEEIADVLIKLKAELVEKDNQIIKALADNLSCKDCPNRESIPKARVNEAFNSIETQVCRSYKKEECKVIGHWICQFKKELLNSGKEKP